MKTCYKCKGSKEKVEFHKDKTKHEGLANICKACTKIKNAKWLQDNPAKAYGKQVLRDARIRACTVKWDTELTELVTQEAGSLIRLRKQATGIDWHTDHIVPVKGENVCGFHVWNNLQVIPAIVNIKKGNKWLS